jgi:hypothetical protein
LYGYFPAPKLNTLLQTTKFLLKKNKKIALLCTISLVNHQDWVGKTQSQYFITRFTLPTFRSHWQKQNYKPNKLWAILKWKTSKNMILF